MDAKGLDPVVEGVRSYENSRVIVCVWELR